MRLKNAQTGDFVSFLRQNETIKSKKQVWKWETADDATETIDRLTALHRKNLVKLENVPTRSRQNIRDLFAYIERNPIIETVKTAAALGLSRNGTA